MPGGTNLSVLAGLRCRSQTPYPYDAYPPGLAVGPTQPVEELYQGAGYIAYRLGGADGR